MAHKRVDSPITLLTQRPKEASHSVIMTLCQSAFAGTHHLLRLTGGMGLMDLWHGVMIGKCVVQGFDGFSGPILFGGTRMVSKTTGRVQFGITEVAPLIRKRNPSVTLIGVAPKLGAHRMDISSNGLATLVISEERGQDYRTILHPEQQLFLSLETNVDPTVFLSEDERYKMWHEEWKECLRIALRVRSSGITPVLFIYNGGEVSEAELLAWAKQGLTCIIVRDSGRCADKYASYESWLKANPTVHVCQRSVDSISAKLADLGVIDPTQAYSRKTRKIA